MSARGNVPRPPYVKGTISNLINGISQQPANIRFQNQADECVNLFPTIQEQCARRNPLEALFKLSGVSGLSTGSYTHWYRRDQSEVYSIIMNGSGIQVYSASDGSLKTVTMSQPGGDVYHQSLTPKDDFFLYTFKDTTFVVNRKIVADLKSTLSTTRTPEALIKVKDAGNAFTYSVTITIGAGAPITSGTITAISTSTVNTIASSIQAAINAAVVVQGGTTTLINNVVHVAHPTLSIQVDYSDNRAGSALLAFTSQIQKSTDLPTYAPNGYLVQVVGSTSSTNAQDANVFDDVYYKFKTSGGSSSGSGIWKESLASGIKYQLDPALMPHTLTRQADGTFVYDDITWVDRTVGSEATNPDPPFIGNTIHSCFLASNRLGFLAGDSFICSKVDEANYYQFFRTTILTSLDNDPVYGAIPSSQVNKVYFASQWNGELMVFGDQLDGAVSWTGALAQSKISINTPSRAGISPLVPPVLSGSALIFPKNRGNYSILYQYQLDPVTSLKTAENLTDFCGSYIPKDVISLVAPEKEFALMLVDGDRSKLYPYNYSIKQSKLVQQAFHRWEFDANVVIYGMYSDVANGTILLLYSIEGSYFIGQINVSVGSQDEFIPGRHYMDFRIDESFSGVSASYNAGTNRTTVTLPFGLTSERTIELRDTFTGPGGDFPPGYLIPIESQTSTTITLVGDWSGASFFTGLRYNSYYDPCKFQTYEPNPDGTGTVANLWHDILLKKVAIAFNNTGFFRLQILDRKTETVVSQYDLNPQYDSISTIYDEYTLYEGTQIEAFGSLSLNTYKLRLSNDSTKPSYFTELSWIGEAGDGAL